MVEHHGPDGADLRSGASARGDRRPGASGGQRRPGRRGRAGGRRLRRVGLLALALVGLLLAVGAGYVHRSVAPVATGYAAKIVCSGHFVSGRTVTDVRRDIPDNPVEPFLSVSVDRTAQRMDAHLLGLWSSTAWYVPGRGCTLADTRPPAVPAGLRDEVTPRYAAGPRGAGRPGLWPSGDDVDTTGAPGVDTGRIAAALDRAFSEKGLADGQVRGSRAIVVVHDGRIVAERYADGFSASTPLLGWSMSKSIAGAVVGRLVGAGALAVDDTDLWPTWDGPRSAITVNHLLHMTSGLRFEEVYEVGTTVTRMLFTPGSTARVAARQPLEAPPGNQWAYSSGATNILCDVARRAGGWQGRDGPAMVDEMVFDPLGMDSAVMEADITGLPVCSSFTYATARDWARFGLLYARDGVWGDARLLPEGWVAASTRPVDVPDAEPYGAQWWLNTAADGSVRLPDLPADAFWASGNEGQHVIVVPSADVVVVRLGLSRGLDGTGWGMEAFVADVLAAVDDGN